MRSYDAIPPSSFSNKACWMDAGNVLSVICAMSVLVVEFYGIYMLATTAPSTEKKEYCPIFAMIIVHVCSLVAISMLAYGLYSLDGDWGGWLSVACVFVASCSAFIASIVVISNKINSECAEEMRGSLILFMILDCCLGAWSAVGWLNVRPSCR